MKMLSNVLVSFVAIQHFLFMVLEMFLWTKPLGMKVFRNSPEKAKLTEVLAMNQGLYNGFLMAGLIWAVYSGDIKLKVFFLSCVIIAGVFGALTASKSILYVQAAPATLALIIVLWHHFS